MKIYQSLILILLITLSVITLFAETKEFYSNKPSHLKTVSTYKTIHRPKSIKGDIPKQAFEALEKSKDFIFYSITPHDYDKKHLYGHGIRGQINITDKKIRLQLTNHLYYSIDKSDGATAACFNPHHAIRVIYKNITWDWIICFECERTYIYKSGKKEPYLLGISHTPQYFNQIVKKYNLNKKN